MGCWSSRAKSACLSAERLGGVATTSAFGCTSWRKTDWSALAGRRVILWADNDAQGAKWQADLGAHLSGIADELLVVDVPAGKPEGWDIADANAKEAKRLIAEAKPWTPTADESKAARFVWGNQIEREAWTYLWHAWMPLGEITMLIGRQKTGKGLLACRLAAAAVGAETWPDGTRSDPGGAVLWVGDEDDPARTIGPRMDAAGMPPDRYAHVYRDLANPAVAMRDLLRSKVPAGVRMIVVDPIIEDMDQDANASTKVRDFLKGWQDVARRHQCVVLGLHHCPKFARAKLKDTGDLLDLAQGSHQFTAVARSNLVYVRDEGDRDAPRLLVHAGANFDDKPKHYGYQVHAEGDGSRTRVARFDPSDDPIGNAVAMIEGKTGGNTVDDAILEYLECNSGEAQSNDVNAAVAEATGRTERWVGERAAKLIEDGRLESTAGGRGKAQKWALPEC